MAGPGAGEVGRSGYPLAGCEEPVVRKHVLQLAGDRAVDLDLHVPPVAELRVEALVFLSDVHSADERDGPSMTWSLR